MTDQSIVKSVTMDEAVLQSGNGSDQQDQIDFEVDEVVSDESLISLLNQKTITLSSKVDTVELEKAKKSQYQYNGVEGDNFVMRYVGRIVRSLVSVAPEQQKEADALIDYARGKFIDPAMEQYFLTDTLQKNLKSDVFVICLLLGGNLTNIFFGGALSMSLPIGVAQLVLMLAFGLIYLNSPDIRYLKLYQNALLLCCCVYISLLFIGLGYIEAVLSRQVTLIGILFYLQPHYFVDIFAIIIGMSLSPQRFCLVVFVSLLVQLCFMLVKLLHVFGLCVFKGLFVDLFVLFGVYLCYIAKVRLEIYRRLKFQNLCVSWNQQVAVSLLRDFCLFLAITSFIVVFCVPVFQNVVSLCKTGLLFVSTGLFAYFSTNASQQQNEVSGNIASWIGFGMSFAFLVEAMYMLQSLNLGRNEQMIVYGLFYNIAGLILLFLCAMRPSRGQILVFSFILAGLVLLLYVWGLLCESSKVVGAGKFAVLTILIGAFKYFLPLEI